MKVLITMPRLDLSGGVASYYQTLRGALGRDKVYFEIGRSVDEKNTFLILKRMWRDSLRFSRELSGEQYSLVHINPSLLSKSFFRDGSLLLLAKLHRKPVVVMFHGWDKVFEQTMERHLLWLFRLIYGQADAFVVLANEFRDKLKKWGCRQPIFVETTVVDDEVMNIAWDVLSANRSASIAFNILFLARMEREKGIYETLDAFLILKQSVPHAQLVIAGEGPDKVPAMQYARERGINDVEFMGFVAGKQKEDALASAHMYLFPTSYGEGMPTSVLEAMAFGLPIITRPVGGLRDFFEDGRMGYLTESLDPRVFAALTERLATNSEQRETMGEYNRLYAQKRFVASKVAARLENIYATVVAGG